MRGLCGAGAVSGRWAFRAADRASLLHGAPVPGVWICRVGTTSQRMPLLSPRRTPCACPHRTLRYSSDAPPGRALSHPLQHASPSHVSARVYVVVACPPAKPWFPTGLTDPCPGSPDPACLDCPDRARLDCWPRGPGAGFFFLKLQADSNMQPGWGPTSHSWSSKGTMSPLTPVASPAQTSVSGGFAN